MHKECKRELHLHFSVCFVDVDDTQIVVAPSVLADNGFSARFGHCKPLVAYEPYSGEAGPPTCCTWICDRGGC